MFRRFLTALTVTGFMTVASLGMAPIAASAADEAAAPAAKSAFTDAQLAELHAIIKQHILDNPQTLITSVESYYNKQNDSKKAQEGTVSQVPAGLYDDPGTPYAGNKDAKFVVVEFFDYNCGYCKQVASDVERVIKDEGAKTKFVFKELPILSEMSEVAARYALAANMQGKYLEYHNALMAHRGPIDPTYLEEQGKQLGLDIIKLKKDADTQEVRDVLAKNIDLARTLGVRGTPFFLVGKTKIPGAIGYSKLKEAIYKERDGVTAPTAPSPEPVTSSDSSGAAGPSSGLDTSVGNDPDVKAAIDDAKKETNDLLKDLQKQAADMQKAAQDMAKQQKALEAAKGASAPAAETAPAAPAVEEKK